MTALGEAALWIALPIALWGTVASFAGGRLGRGQLVASGERSVHVVTALLILVSAGIIAAFLGNRYEYLYVVSYSNRELDPYFKFAGLWAGQRGSLVFWTLLLSVFSSIAVFRNRLRNREFMPYVSGTLLGILAFLLVVLLFADVNPFERLGFTRINGLGLNPQLQNYWMTIHPPTLYLGFTAFAVPFAFAVSALLTGRLDSRWIAVTRRWILLSWFFLTLGIIFGMRWAYEELGWGGYWFWDPVENASLLPWLTATAFLHSIQIQEHRGMLKVWNMVLVTVTFLLTIFATFLTRSGLIESVHSFAENLRIAYIFLGFMCAMGILAALLIVHRLPSLRPENQIRSFLSRESAFLFNNLLLVGITFAVAWGTLFPLITEGLLGETRNVGPPYFNRVNIPVGLLSAGAHGRRADHRMAEGVGQEPEAELRPSAPRRCRRTLCPAPDGGQARDGACHLRDRRLRAGHSGRRVLEGDQGEGTDRRRGRAPGYRRPRAQEPAPLGRVRRARGRGRGLHGDRRGGLRPARGAGAGARGGDDGDLGAGRRVPAGVREPIPLAAPRGRGRRGERLAVDGSGDRLP